MKALVLEQPNQLVYKDVSEPAIGPDDVLIQVKATGICGSDIHGMDGSTGRRIPPIIMGHESAGVIAHVGENATGWQVGDRVTLDSTVYCGACYYCQRGEINLCDNRRVLGVSCSDYRQHGAFAEFVSVPHRILYRLPDGLTFTQAAMTEPVSIAVHAVKRTPLPPNCTAVVVGTGMIGLLVVQALRQAGCDTVIAIDRDPNRLTLAVELGADVGLQSDHDDVMGRVAEMTGGRGADVAFEVVGITATLQWAVQLLRKGGQLTLVGNLSPTVDLPLQTVVTRELTLNGSCASRGEYADCLNMIAQGEINVNALISAVAPLSEGASWFKRLYAAEPGLLKVMLVP
ncbi:MAG: galactitol-1-phosphate 5-dehydrogenase [Chloroflexi bacterium]|nr:galactitol-1-phosphate 5-dehydrogenase [Chloroflexota bacterium]